MARGDGQPQFTPALGRQGVGPPHQALVATVAVHQVDEGQRAAPGQFATRQRPAIEAVLASGTPAALAGNFSLALDLVAAGVGRAIVPESLAQEMPGVQIWPLEVALKRRIGLCYNVQALGNGALARLRDGVLAA